MKAMWTTFHDSYDVDVLVVPTTPITSRPIDDVEPYVTVNGRKVQCHKLHLLRRTSLYHGFIYAINVHFVEGCPHLSDQISDYTTLQMT